MKMNKADLEFVAFAANDVIMTSGDGYFFVMSDFTDPIGWESWEFFFANNDPFLYVNPIDANAAPLSVIDLNQTYQLVNTKSVLNHLQGEGNEAYVVAEIVEKGTGEQIKTWEKLLWWIEQYGQ